MTTRKLNVLVYSALYSLRRLLSSHYAVIPVLPETIVKQPWTASCALLVFPGGADLGYCRSLNGEGNRRIRQYVERGGSYLGLCAGGYYGSSRCEFEVGNPTMEVVGKRELALYPGICRGCAYPGFVYHSEKGARATELRIDQTALGGSVVPQAFRCYYNGGGVFVDAKSFKERGVEVLAEFTTTVAVDGGDGRAAVVYCRVGEGAAVLTSPHPEFAAANLDRNAGHSEFKTTVDELAAGEGDRVSFLKACLVKLGLTVNEQESPVPLLSHLHLSALNAAAMSDLLECVGDVTVIEDGEEYFRGENDVFRFQKPLGWATDGTQDAEDKPVAAMTDVASANLDHHGDAKQVVVHEGEYPACKETPFFNHHAFFANLKQYQSSVKIPGEFGRCLLYGEVVTSTSTMLEKNARLLHNLPNGFTATATVQVQGRGRGANVWVSPAGSLMFSTCVRHPADAMGRAPVVFLQYLAAMAIVEGIQSYDLGYRDVPLRLKWPNDIYAQDPGRPGGKNYVKIGGILVNSSYAGGEYFVVVGAGVNATNAAPTTSLNALLPAHLAPFTLEKLLARILTVFEDFYHRFLRKGFAPEFEALYYKQWLHSAESFLSPLLPASDQIVILEAEGGVRARIKGITRDYGLLQAEEVNVLDRATGKMWELQSDNNSFDFMKGLVKRKM
ncbi:MAG: biotin holocarboxylase synthetase [Phylliscum demangeonii]|nr:MAG: biotin holocarboxylase synthetase [Phylliscum demangeonii]